MTTASPTCLPKRGRQAAQRGDLKEDSALFLESLKHSKGGIPSVQFSLVQ